MEEDQNQHYVTRAFLAKFIHPTSKQAVLYPYAVNEKKQKAKGPAKLACEKNFYKQEINGEWCNCLEKDREKLETMLFDGNKGTHYECLHNEKFVPSAEDRIILCVMAAYLHAGSPLQIHNTSMMGLYSNQIYLMNRINSDDAEEIYKQECGNDWEMRLKEDRKQVLTGELVADVGESLRKQFGFESFKYQELWIQMMSQMSLSIVTTNEFFITSDNPVIIFSRHRSKGQQFREVELQNFDAEIWIPISYNKGLLWRQGKNGFSRFSYGHSETRAINRKVISMAYKSIYAPLEADWLNEATQNVPRDHIYKHYGSLERAFATARPGIDVSTGRKIDVLDIVRVMESGDEMDVLGI